MVQIIMQGVLLASITILPQFLQSLMGYDAFLSGLAVMPRGVGALSVSIIIGTVGSSINPKVLVVSGMVLLSISSFMLSGLNLEISTINIAIPNFIMGGAMAMSMIPIITLSTMTLTNEQMTNASGVPNLLKNLGGAIGTSVITTIISRRAQVHQHYLVDNLTATNNVFLERLQSYIGAFMGNTDINHATELANSVLYKQMLLQANMCAFKDAFELSAIACLALIPLLLLLKGIPKKQK